MTIDPIGRRGQSDQWTQGTMIQQDPHQKWGRRPGRKHKYRKISQETTETVFPEESVLDLSGYIISDCQMSLLTKGLVFNIFETIMDINTFARILTIKNNFFETSPWRIEPLSGRSSVTDTPAEINIMGQTLNFNYLNGIEETAIKTF